MGQLRLCDFSFRTSLVKEFIDLGKLLPDQAKFEEVYLLSSFEGQSSYYKSPNPGVKLELDYTPFSVPFGWGDLSFAVGLGYQYTQATGLGGDLNLHGVFSNLSTKLTLLDGLFGIRLNMMLGANTIIAGDNSDFARGEAQFFLNGEKQTRSYSVKIPRQQSNLLLGGVFSLDLFHNFVNVGLGFSVYTFNFDTQGDSIRRGPLTHKVVENVSLELGLNFLALPNLIQNL